MVSPALPRMTAEYDKDFVVFLIGMRINSFWKMHHWLLVLRAMGPMIKELESRPESGFLGYEKSGFQFIQYWNSVEQLIAYAHARDSQHWPSWTAFNQKVGYTGGGVDIWHETFLVKAGAYEAIYGNMPAFGMAKFAKIAPAAGHLSDARRRLLRLSEAEAREQEKAHM